MKMSKDGWLTGVRRLKSPNFDTRPAHTAIDLLVIHNISLPPDEFDGDAIIQLFTNTLDCTVHPYYAQLDGVKVSAHFLIRRDGSMTQFVSCLDRAWHAGVSQWQGRERCNDFSIGIELEGSDFVAFTDEQYSALKLLTKKIKQAYPIRACVGHSDIAPKRKTDPGPFFDWPRYLSAN